MEKVVFQLVAIIIPGTAQTRRTDVADTDPLGILARHQERL